MYKCEQCGKTIYFEGICLSCESENEKKTILSMTTDEIEKQISEICNEIKQLKEIDTKRQSFTDLINYRNIDTSKIADVAFENKVYYPCEIYKNASDEVVNAMIELLKDDDLNRSDANCITSLSFNSWWRYCF